MKRLVGLLRLLRPAVLIAAAAFVLVAMAAFSLWVWLGTEPMSALDYDSVASVQIEDKDGELLSERGGTAPAGDFSRLRPTPLSRISPAMVRTIIAAEDRRFFKHDGIDGVALWRAAWENLRARRIRSGGSTITQQLVRVLHPRPRASFVAKLREWAYAYRLERQLSKWQILEAYLNRVPFGNGTFGVEAAAWRYLGKPAAQLSLGEAAALSAIPRAPSLYQPYRKGSIVRVGGGSEGGDELATAAGGVADAGRLAMRRREVLLRAVAAGLVGAEDARRASAEPLVLQPQSTPFRAPRFVAWALKEAEAAAREEGGARLGRVRTTLDSELQSIARGALRRALRDLSTVGATNGAVVVLDVRSSEVLAYVASADYFDAAAGQVDGARARRSPGSALKPFVYALGFERGDHPATVVADMPTHFATATGDYSPRNFDSRFHGPVSLRTALGSSYNVPAVELLSRAGVSTLADRLRDLGLSTLSQDASIYGLGLALGDAEVRLIDLTAAYAALGRGGEYVPPRGVRAALDVKGNRIAAAGLSPPPRLVFSADVVALVSDVLRDPVARRPAFGVDSALDLEVPVAVKTGTSKDHRDVWTLGYTPEVAVGVWIGDMSGRPMSGLSGVGGAAPVFAEVMEATLRRAGIDNPGWAEREPRGSGALVSAAVCPRSGLLPGPDCPGQVIERFRRGQIPRESCGVHRAVWIDRQDGRLSSAGCQEAERRVFEVYTARLLRWAMQVGLPQPPTERSRCLRQKDGARPALATASSPLPIPLQIRHPQNGDEFAIDGNRPGLEQRLWFHADVADESLRRVQEGAATPRIEWRVDGQPIAEVGPPFSASWPLARGRHRIEARLRGGGLGPSSVSITVR